jgi:hypothetical protein
VSRNSNGIILAVGSGGITAVETIASNNVGDGFGLQLGGVLMLAHSSATGNGTGVNNQIGRGTVTSFGDNHIHGNGTDIHGTLIKVGTQ